MFNNFEVDMQINRYNNNNRNRSTDTSINLDQNSYNMDINRRIMERDNMFNQNTTKNTYNFLRTANNRFSEYNSNVGEITGEQYNVSELEQGMPTRYNNLNVDPKDFDLANDKSCNRQLDFDLYDKHSTIDVLYHDPNNGHSQHFSDFNTEGGPSIPNSINPTMIYKTCISGFSWHLLMLFRHHLKNNYKINNITISPYSILNSLSVIYRGSTKDTEKILHNNLFYKNKKIIHHGATELINQINKQKDIISFNMSLFPMNTPINPTFQRFIKNMCILANTGNKYNHEINRINKLVQKYTYGVFQNVIGINDIRANGGLFLSLFYIKCNWLHPFDKNRTTNETFYRGNKRTNVKMMTLHNYEGLSINKYNYSVTEHYQVLELDFKNKSLAMGFILPTNNIKIPKISEEQILNHINNLQHINLSTIKIPKFTHIGKYNMNSILKSINIGNIFSQAQLSDITSSPTKVSHVIHQSIIVVDECDNNHNGMNYKRILHDTGTERNEFIANHPFLYYIRHKPLNTILLTGIMC